MHIAISLVVGVGTLIIILGIYLTGYEAGVKDTEKRWADAVAKKGRYVVRGR